MAVPGESIQITVSLWKSYQGNLNLINFEQNDDNSIPR